MRLRAALALLVAGCVGEQGGEARPDLEDGATVEDAAASETTKAIPPGDASIFPTEDVGSDAPAAESGPGDYPLPPIASTCPRTAHVLTYNPNGWDSLADAFEANPSPCANYLVHLPAVATDKTRPRGPTQPASIRARKGRFFAVAEFDYAAWSARTDLTWSEKGIEFRKRMDAAGYNVARGDTWAIHSLPASLFTEAAVRTNVINLVRGLYTGPAGSMASGGVVLVTNTPHETTSFTVYKPALRTWLVDGAFFTEMNKFVRYWGHEAYTSAKAVCVGGSTVAGRAERVNDFVMHPGRLAHASAAPTTASMARTFFGTAYVPMMSAFWKSSGAYGATDVSLDAMKHHVSLQTYAARLWLETHTFPDGRLGFAWDETAGTLAERVELATRLAQSIRDAYAPGATASRACSPTGAYTWCDCAVAESVFNDSWKTFSTW
jgi:hypothetical protein